MSTVVRPYLPDPAPRKEPAVRGPAFANAPQSPQPRSPRRRRRGRGLASAALVLALLAGSAFAAFAVLRDAPRDNKVVEPQTEFIPKALPSSVCSIEYQTLTIALEAWQAQFPDAAAPTEAQLVGTFLRSEVESYDIRDGVIAPAEGGLCT